MEKVFEAIPVKNKPIISYWKVGDPCLKLQYLSSKITDINIINTKRLTNEFIDFCILNKNRIFLHINITGAGKTIFEPNIPTVRESFFQIKRLLDLGFSQKQILVVVNPILQNDNGLNSLKLLLKVFTEFKPLRLRFIRFNLLHYRQLEDKPNQFVISNYNIVKRSSTKQIMMYLTKNSSFMKDYYKLIDDYSAIISIDKGDEALIGIRELLPFGYKNEWIDETTGNRIKLITYENNNKYKPIVNIISPSDSRCVNRCLLCPNKN
jgi:hypothetical protein